MSTITTSSFDWSARHKGTASDRSISDRSISDRSASNGSVSSRPVSNRPGSQEFASSGFAAHESASAEPAMRPQVTEAVASQMAAAIGGVGGANGLTLFGGTEQLFAGARSTESYWALPAGRLSGLRKIVHCYSLADADLPDDDPGASDALLPADRISA